MKINTLILPSIEDIECINLLENVEEIGTVYVEPDGAIEDGGMGIDIADMLGNNSSEGEMLPIPSSFSVMAVNPIDLEKLFKDGMVDINKTVTPNKKHDDDIMAKGFLKSLFDVLGAGAAVISSPQPTRPTDNLGVSEKLANAKYIAVCNNELAEIKKGYINPINLPEAAKSALGVDAKLYRGYSHYASTHNLKDETPSESNDVLKWIKLANTHLSRYNKSFLTDDILQYYAILKALCEAKVL